MTAMIGLAQRNFLAPKFFVPSALLLWLLISLIFMLLIPRADARSTSDVCPSEWGYESDSPTMTENGAPAPASGALRGVYNPSRLMAGNNGVPTKYDICQQASGTVTYVELWDDGDWDVYVQLDPEYLPEGSSPLVGRSDVSNLRYWTQAKNVEGSHQAADMLWEVVRGDQGTTCGDGTQAFNTDPQKGNAGSGGTGMVQPSAGDHIEVVGAWVRDNNHNFNELHRLYQINNTTTATTCTAALSP